MPEKRAKEESWFFVIHCLVGSDEVSNSFSKYSSLFSSILFFTLKTFLLLPLEEVNLDIWPFRIRAKTVLYE